MRFSAGGFVGLPTALDELVNVARQSQSVDFGASCALAMCELSPLGAQHRTHLSLSLAGIFGNPLAKIRDNLSHLCEGVLNN